MATTSVGSATVDLEGIGYKAGSVILKKCEPLFKTISPHLRESRCNRCFVKTQPLMKCIFCSQTYYCTKTCQKVDWSDGHRLQCQLLDNKEFCTFMFDGPYSEDKFLLLKIYSSLKMQPEVATNKHRTVDGRSVCFDEMPSFPGTEEARGPKIEACEIMEGFINTIHKGLPKYMVKLDDLHHWMGVKTFPILAETDTNRIGVGVYVEPAFLSHSCVPTATYVNIGPNLQVRAICDIEAGEPPSICYLKGNRDRETRQSLLKELYDLDCECIKCTERTDSQVDYKKLDEMLATMMAYENLSVDGSSWVEIYAIHQKILTIFWKIYKPYDERATEEHKLAFEIAFRSETHEFQLKRLRNTAREWMLNTYGTEHPSYKAFVASTAHLSYEYRE